MNATERLTAEDEPCLCGTDFTCMATEHDPATPPADDASRAPVSGGLDEGERVRCPRCGGGDMLDHAVAAHVDRILAAHDAAWVERLAAVEGERDEAERVGREWRATAFDLEDRAEAAEAERDTARREADALTSDDGSRA